jgi:adenylate kinase
MKQIYSFIGLPASGKGTQAEIFATKHHFTPISIGNLVREAIVDETNPDKNEINKYYTEGKPVPDEIVFRLLEAKIKTINEGILFDNFPFTDKQSEWIEKYVSDNNLAPLTIIYINISPESAFKRIEIRTYCPKCGLTFKDGETSCPKCGGKLEQRADDNPATLKKRISQYEQGIRTILNIYQPKEQVIEINGELSIKEVEEEIDNKIK